MRDGLMSMTANLTEPIRREARRSGLGGRGSISMREVERRRLELWGIVLAMLTAVCAGVVVLSAWPRPADSSSLLSAPVLRAAMVLLAIGFGAYVMEKELHLRKLSGLITDERVTIEALTRRIEEDTALTTAGRAIGAMLDVERTIDLILESGLGLLEAKDGAIFLVDRPGTLRCVAARGLAKVGDRVAFNERIEGRVAVKQEPVLIPAPRRGTLPGGFDQDASGDMMCAPLMNGAELIGVIRLDAPRGQPFADSDLVSLEVFAEHVAPQVANAQMYQRERARVGELLEVYRLKADFVSAMVNELAPPLRAMVGSVENLRELQLTPQQRWSVLDLMDREGTRLLRLVDRLGRQGRHGARGATVGEDHVDVGVLARAVAAELGRRGRPVEVVAEDGCVVLGDEEIVQPILINLVDNAYRHGAPPVTIRVERRGDQVVMSVEDRGPGIPPELRQSVFAGLPPAGSQQGERAGAGLSIVRGVVAALRGTVWVDEVPGGGAAFRIAFPVDSRVAASTPGDPAMDELESGVPTPGAFDDMNAAPDLPPERDFVAAASELSALASEDGELRMTAWGLRAMPASPPAAAGDPSAPAPPPMPGA
ncbi:MAG TPA: GAF domain-containing sensor histidine kinase [Actinomycetota bacterium]|nr:GAF domain-containing sensor histidine kinase [Actinomycetota bacterium]